MEENSKNCLGGIRMNLLTFRPTNHIAIGGAGENGLGDINMSIQALW